MALDDFQVSFGGLTIGEDTEYDIDLEKGLESFEVRASDVDMPRGWGTFPGVDEVAARTIELTVQMLAEDPAIPKAFEDAFLPSDETLTTLGFKFPEYDEQQLEVRCRKRSRRRAVQETFGLIEITVELAANDPRAYSAALQEESVATYSAGGEGLDLTAGSGADLAFDLTAGSGADLAFDFSGVTAIGDVICTNNGNVDTYPSILFSAGGSGAMSDFRLTNATTGDVLHITATVSPGSPLVADMAAVATPAGGLPIAIGAASRYASWVQPRIPLRLAPGPNTLRFEVIAGASSGASALISWRHARL